MNLGNLSQRISNIEGAISDLSNKFTQVNRELTNLRSDCSGLRDRVEPAVERLDRTVKGLQNDFSQLGQLVDDSIAPQIPLHPVPQAPVPQEEKPHVSVQYDSEGQPFVAALPGAKEAVERSGYSVIGLFTKGTDNQTYFKLRLGVMPERRQ